MSDRVFLTVWGLLPDATESWQESVLLGREVSPQSIPAILSQCQALAVRDGVRNVRHTVEPLNARPDFTAAVHP